MAAWAGVTNLVLTIVAVPAVLIVGAWVIARTWGDSMARVGPLVWAFTAAFTGLSVVVGVVLYVDQQREYEACVLRVEGRDGGRAMFDRILGGVEDLRAGLEGVIPQEAGAALAEMVDGWRGDMNELLPKLDASQCPKPLSV